MCSLTLLLFLAAPADLLAQGLVLHPRPEHSMALLRGEGRSRVVAVGESAWGGRVIAINATGVVLDFDGQRVDVPLSGARPTPVVAAAPALVPAPMLDAEPRGRKFERHEVERRLGQESARILAETTLLPVMEQGAVTGFTLTRIPENSLLTDAGLQAGDVLVSVNDTRIDGMAALMGLWPRLQGESNLRAVVLRNGQPVTLTVSLR